MEVRITCREHSFYRSCFAGIEEARAHMAAHNEARGSNCCQITQCSHGYETVLNSHRTPFGLDPCSDLAPARPYGSRPHPIVDRVT